MQCGDGEDAGSASVVEEGVAVADGVGGADPFEAETGGGVDSGAPSVAAMEEADRD